MNFDQLLHDICLETLEEDRAKYEQDLDTKYDRQMKMVKPSLEECRKRVKETAHIQEKMDHMRRDKSKPICLSVAEYINAIMMFYDKNEKADIIQNKIDRYKTDDSIPISQNGRWIDMHLTSGIKKVIHALIKENLPCLEAFVICLCEYHSRLMHLYFDDKLFSVDDLIMKTACHPEYINFVDDMKFVRKYFQMLAVFELPLLCRGKSNEEIIAPHMRLFKAFHIPMQLPYRLSEKYEHMCQVMCDEAVCSHGRFEMHLRVWSILVDTTINNTQKCRKLKTLVPCQDILRPLHICMRCKMQQHRDSIRHRFAQNPTRIYSLDVDFDTITDILLGDFYSITGYGYLDINFDAILQDPNDPNYHELHDILDKW